MNVRLSISHEEYLRHALDAEPVRDAGRRWASQFERPRDQRRFLHLVDGVAKRWGWGRADEQGDELLAIALRRDAKRLALDHNGLVRLWFR